MAGLVYITMMTIIMTTIENITTIMTAVVTSMTTIKLLVIPR